MVSLNSPFSTITVIQTTGGSFDTLTCHCHKVLSGEASHAAANSFQEKHYLTVHHPPPPTTTAPMMMMTKMTSRRVLVMPPATGKSPSPPWQNSRENKEDEEESNDEPHEAGSGSEGLDWKVYIGRSFQIKLSLLQLRSNCQATSIPTMKEVWWWVTVSFVKLLKIMKWEN